MSEIELQAARYRFIREAAQNEEILRVLEEVGGASASNFTPEEFDDVVDEAMRRLGFVPERGNTSTRTGEIMSYYRRWDAPEVKFEELVGKTLREVRGAVGDVELEFVCEDGSIYALFHSQDCCESVAIESIVGDLSDLIGTPILKAEEASSDKDPEGYKQPEDDYYRESFTWTFYKLATMKGYVDIRWYGSSNGYYSESVDFTRVSGPVTKASDAAH